MYAVSDQYKQAIALDTRDFKIRANIFFADNTMKIFDDSTIENEVIIESQSELAKRTGIRPSTISDICNNNADFIKIDYLNRILEALKCGLNDVLEYKDGGEL